MRTYEGRHFVGFGKELYRKNSQDKQTKRLENRRNPKILFPPGRQRSQRLCRPLAIMPNKHPKLVAEQIVFLLVMTASDRFPERLQSPDALSRHDWIGPR
jgi:hypothetical protein